MTIACKFCGGTAREPGTSYAQCTVCKGRAKLTIVGNPELHPCPFCGGTTREPGTSYTRCPVCKGLGTLNENGDPLTIAPTESRIESPPTQPVPPGGFPLIAPTRIDDLRKLTPAQLDFKKLIRLCDELNTAYSQECYYATIMLTRSMLDHVPPVFGKTTFVEVVNNYDGGKSFKETMQRLEDAARKIADAHLHMPMRKAEVLPVAQQVNFGAQLDVLLAEIVRITR